VSGVWVVLALLLPTVCGVALWQWLLGRPRDVYAWCAAIGAGYLGGCAALGALLRSFDGAATGTLFVQLAPWLAGAAILLGLAGALRAPPIAAIEGSGANARERAMIVATWLLVACAGALILQQAIALPTLTWDAWNAWLAKSKAWYHAGHFVAVLDFEPWRDAAPGTAITTTAPAYPQALPRFATWLASAAGHWSEPAVHAAWPLAWLAMGLACFGYLGMAGARALPATLAAAALLLLPIVTAHAALAGYADLWLAAIVLLAAAHLTRWFAHRGWRDAVAALLFALLATTVKLEGAVWSACLVAAAVLAWLPPRLRWSALALPPLFLLAVWIFGGVTLPLPGLGMIRFEWGQIELPVLGAMRLAWRPVLDEFALALLLLPNWSLLWYLAPLVPLLRWRALLRQRELAALGGFLALGYAFLFLLFFFTDAAVWAENFTSINRVLMHIVPATMLWLTLLWVAPTVPRTAPSTAA
jgi:hypothetical protein